MLEIYYIIISLSRLFVNIILGFIYTKQDFSIVIFNQQSKTQSKAKQFYSSIQITHLHKKKSFIRKKGLLALLFQDCGGTVQVLTVFNVYCPRVDSERPDRASFKIDFYRMLRDRASVLRRSGSHVIIVGDLNTSHRKIDHCDPEEDPVSFFVYLFFIYNKHNICIAKLPKTHYR